jgi:hypothetical protein
VWRKDLARAGIVGALYALAIFGALAAGGAYSGALGGVYLVLALLLGPFVGAWIAGWLLPERIRVRLLLGLGAIAGGALYFAVLKVFENPLGRIGEDYQAYIVIGGWILGTTLGAFFLSRWRRVPAPVSPDAAAVRAS